MINVWGINSFSDDRDDDHDHDNNRPIIVKESTLSADNAMNLR